LTFDLWSANGTAKKFLGLTGHFVDDGVLANWKYLLEIAF